MSVNPLFMILITLHLSYTNELYIVLLIKSTVTMYINMTSETGALRPLNEHGRA